MDYRGLVVVGILKAFCGFAAPDSLVGRVHSVCSTSVELLSFQGMDRIAESRLFQEKIT